MAPPGWLPIRDRVVALIAEIRGNDRSLDEPWARFKRRQQINSELLALGEECRLLDAEYYGVPFEPVAVEFFAVQPPAPTWSPGRDWRSDFKNEKGRPGWHALYHDYLQSEEWKGRRALVLDRDSGRCQGCLVYAADHVHHRTYSHVGGEFAFELTSLCRGCHSAFHDKDDPGSVS